MRILVLFLATIAAYAQATFPVRPDWRRIGNTAIDASLASLASGPVERVWYSETGERLLVRTLSGKVFATDDYERWVRVAGPAEPPAAASVALPVRPESGSRLLARSAGRGRLYAAGRAVYRSENGGLNWTNLTEFRRVSIIGDGLMDLAVSPRDADEIAVADLYGVWRSVDGGRTWTGLNDGLPNLPARRLAGLPGNGRGVRLVVEGLGEYEWVPGEKNAWRPADDGYVLRRLGLRRTLSAAVEEPVLAVAAAGSFLYAGGDGGRLWASADGGSTWQSFRFEGAGPVERIFVVPGSPRVALAVFGPAEPGAPPVHVAKTTNSGLFWDDITGDLPDAAAHGVTADAASGAVYVATDEGAWFTTADLRGAGRSTGWTPLTAGLIDSPVHDVRLDEAGNQIYIAVDGEGVFAAMAPHRFLLPVVVNAADLRARAAAPGVLLSVLGAEVRTARAGSAEAPVLAASAGESQIQVPFEVSGDALTLALTTSGRTGALERYTLGIPLLEASPAIFVDRDGTPMVLDADSGVLLDAMTPARPGSRVQVLATGLGRVDPAWPSGMPAPLEDPPRVISPVRIMLDRTPIEATRAMLAPGYVGFYLVEFVVPDIVNAGPAELYIEVNNTPSNRTRVYLEP